MTAQINPDLTARLRSHMQAAGFTSFKAFAEAAGVSEWTIRQLRSGRIQEIRLADLQALSRGLNCSLQQLLSRFGVAVDAADLPQPSSSQPDRESPSPAATQAQLTALQQEYRRLEATLSQQQETLAAEFQQQALATIEPWLLQWPTVVAKVQQSNEIPAARLLPLVKPVEALLQQWQVICMAPVGTELPYDPHQHQLIEGTAEAGDPVRVRYAGYTHQGKLLFRAKVSPA